MKLAFEKEMLGIYVSDHPLREIADEVRAAADYSLGDIDELKDGTIGWFAGILVERGAKPTKKGTLMAIVTLEDLDGSIEAVLFPQATRSTATWSWSTPSFALKAKLEDSDRGKKLIVPDLEPFDGAAFGKPPEQAHHRHRRRALVNGRHDKLVRSCSTIPGGTSSSCIVWDEAGTRSSLQMPRDGEQGRERPARRAHRALWRRGGARPRA